MQQTNRKTQRYNVEAFIEGLGRLCEKHGVRLDTVIKLSSREDIISQTLRYETIRNYGHATEVGDFVNYENVFPEPPAAETIKKCYTKCAPYVTFGMKEYEPPLSGKLVTSKYERREEMKRFGVREVDPSETGRWKQNKGEC